MKARVFIEDDSGRCLMRFTSTIDSACTAITWFAGVDYGFPIHAGDAVIGVEVNFTVRDAIGDLHHIVRKSFDDVRVEHIGQRLITFEE